MSSHLEREARQQIDTIGKGRKGDRIGKDREASVTIGHYGLGPSEGSIGRWMQGSQTAHEAVSENDRESQRAWPLFSGRGRKDMAVTDAGRSDQMSPTATCHGSTRRTTIRGCAAPAGTRLKQTLRHGPDRRHSGEQGKIKPSTARFRCSSSPWRVVASIPSSQASKLQCCNLPDSTHNWIVSAWAQRRSRGCTAWKGS